MVRSIATRAPNSSLSVLQRSHAEPHTPRATGAKCEGSIGGRCDWRGLFPIAQRIDASAGFRAEAAPALGNDNDRRSAMSPVGAKAREPVHFRR